MSLIEFAEAVNEWNEVFEKLDSDRKRYFETKYGSEFHMLMVRYALATDSHRDFDVHFYQLSSEHQYHESLIIPVVNYLRKRKPLEAVRYIDKGYAFYDSLSVAIPPVLENLYNARGDEERAADMKTALEGLTSLSTQALPLAIPNRISHSKKRTDEFLLGQIIEAIKLLAEKVQSIEYVIHPEEDNYTDILASILNFRLGIWGWKTGPAHSGYSATKSTGKSPRKKPGRLDIAIHDVGGTMIGLIEALMLSGKKTSSIETHVLKCLNYNKNLETYFILAFYCDHTSKTRTTFVSTCDAYEKTFQGISFPAEHKLATSFEKINWFRDTKGMVIHRTKHLNGQTYFHILVNMGKAV